MCNLGSVNLVAHLKPSDDPADGGRMVIDHEKLARTIRTAMRMLDNVIDINYYAVGKARNSNLKHRPVGLGIMGFQDCLHVMRVPYASAEAVEFADRSMEAVCYYAYLASTELAEERGRYASFRGSLWDRGILPKDSLDLLAQQRGAGPDGTSYLEVDRSETLDWNALRERIRAHGMRNSNCVAIAPTATISNIIGVSACIEPTFQNLYVKSNLSGEFTVVNEYLVRDLKRLGLWDEVMVADLKFFDGSLARIDRVPQELREIYATAFEVDPSWLVEAASRRQKWIDQAQSLNIYMAGASGQQAPRHLHAGLAARTEDHLLPAHPRRHQRGEVHLRAHRPAQRGLGRRQCGRRLLVRGRRIGDGRARGVGIERGRGARTEILRDRRSGLRGLPVARPAFGARGARRDARGRRQGVAITPNGDGKSQGGCRRSVAVIHSRRKILPVNNRGISRQDNELSA